MAGKALKASGTCPEQHKQCALFPYMAVYINQDIKQQPRIPNNKTSPCEYGLDIYYC